MELGVPPAAAEQPHHHPYPPFLIRNEPNRAPFPLNIPNLLPLRSTIDTYTSESLHFSNVDQKQKEIHAFLMTHFLTQRPLPNIPNVNLPPIPEDADEDQLAMIEQQYNEAFRVAAINAPPFLRPANYLGANHAHGIHIPPLNARIKIHKEFACSLMPKNAAGHHVCPCGAEPGSPKACVRHLNRRENNGVYTCQANGFFVRNPLGSLDPLNPCDQAHAEEYFEKLDPLDTNDADTYFHRCTLCMDVLSIHLNDFESKCQHLNHSCPLGPPLPTLGNFVGLKPALPNFRDVSRYDPSVERLFELQDPICRLCKKPRIQQDSPIRQRRSSRYISCEKCRDTVYKTNDRISYYNFYRGNMTLFPSKHGLAKTPQTALISSYRRDDHQALLVRAALGVSKLIDKTNVSKDHANLPNAQAAIAQATMQSIAHRWNTGITDAIRQEDEYDQQYRNQKAANEGDEYHPPGTNFVQHFGPDLEGVNRVMFMFTRSSDLLGKYNPAANNRGIALAMHLRNAMYVFISSFDWLIRLGISEIENPYFQLGKMTKEVI